MRFKSQAQRRKFAELLVKGEIDAETFEQWNRDTGSARLPERVTPARKKRRRKATTSRRAARGRAAKPGGRKKKSARK